MSRRHPGTPPPRPSASFASASCPCPRLRAVCGTDPTVPTPHPTPSCLVAPASPPVPAPAPPGAGRPSREARRSRAGLGPPGTGLGALTRLGFGTFRDTRLVAGTGWGLCRPVPIPLPGRTPVFRTPRGPRARLCPVSAQTAVVPGSQSPAARPRPRTQPGSAACHRLPALPPRRAPKCTERPDPVLDTARAISATCPRPQPLLRGAPAPGTEHPGGPGGHGSTGAEAVPLDWPPFSLAVTAPGRVPLNPADPRCPPTGPRTLPEPQLPCPHGGARGAGLGVARWLSWARPVLVSVPEDTGGIWGLSQEGKLRLISVASDLGLQAHRCCRPVQGTRRVERESAPLRGDAAPPAAPLLSCPPLLASLAFPPSFLPVPAPPISPVNSRRL